MYNKWLSFFDTSFTKVASVVGSIFILTKCLFKLGHCIRHWTNIKTTNIYASMSLLYFDHGDSLLSPCFDWVFASIASQTVDQHCFNIGICLESAGIRDNKSAWFYFPWSDSLISPISMIRKIESDFPWSHRVWVSISFIMFITLPLM